MYGSWQFPRGAERIAQPPNVVPDLFLRIAPMVGIDNDEMPVVVAFGVNEHVIAD